jgi:hypothetical protein
MRKTRYAIEPGLRGSESSEFGQAHDDKTCSVLGGYRRNGVGRRADRYNAITMRIAKAGGQSRQHSLSGCHAVTFEIGD